MEIREIFLIQAIFVCIICSVVVFLPKKYFIKYFGPILWLKKNTDENSVNVMIIFYRFMAIIGILFISGAILDIFFNYDILHRILWP